MDGEQKEGVKRVAAVEETRLVRGRQDVGRKAKLELGASMRRALVKGRLESLH